MGMDATEAGSKTHAADSPPTSGRTADQSSLAGLKATLAAREAELAAARAELGQLRQLSAIVRDSPVAVIRWRLEPGWPVEYVSENIARFGYSAGDLMSGAVSLFDVIEPTDREPIGEPGEETVGPFRQLTYSWRSPTGRRLVRLIVRTIRDAGGRIVCEGVLRETAQSVEDDEHLRLLRLAVNTTQNGIIIADARAADNPIIYANRAVTRISGYAFEEIVGRNCRFLQGRDRDQPGLEIVRTALRERRSCETIVRNYRKDGTLFWNEIRISPVTNHRGEVTHFIGVQADITARKEAETALARRDRILEAVSHAAETLLRSADYQRALPTALRQLGEATGADHLCVWREGAEAAGRTLNLEQMWSADPAHRHPREGFQAIPWETNAGWPSADLLRTGRWLQGGRAGCTPQEQSLLTRLGVESFLCLPIFEGPDRFWGALTLGCVPRGIAWAPIEVEALLSATRVLGAVIQNRTTAEALRVSELRFRTLVSNLKEVVFQTDAQGDWTYLNPAWTEVTGFALEETIGRPFLGYVHPDDRERNARLFTPLIERRKDYCRHEVRYLTRAGGFRWIEVFARLTVDASNRITGTTGTLTDITERRDAEETRRRQLAAIEAAIDGVAIADASGVFTYLNSTHVNLFGFDTAEELIGRTWRELYAPEQRREIEERIFPELQRLGRWRGVMKARRRDGGSFDEELSLTLIEGGGMVCVCRDITQSRKSAERIEASLREKEVMLKEIHHRVKNNMQIVSSLLNLQLEQIRSEETRTLFLESQNRIASMALVHEKLYQSADLGRIDFSDYARDLTDNLVGAQGPRARGIEFRLECGDIHVGIDTAIPCGLIINELVSNAYKHGFPTGGPGTVELRLGRDRHGWLVLEVADTGCGIPAGVDLRQTRSLGMQLVHMLVQQLRGTIDVQRGTGTRFVLHLQEAPQKNPIS